MYSNCFITNDINQIQLMSNAGVRIVALVDEADMYKYSGCITAGVLLPNYDSLSADIDGHRDIAMQLYAEWLDTDVPQRVFGIILAALRGGVNICFFIPEDPSGDWANTSLFIDYFANKFGIVIGDRIGLGRTSDTIVYPDPNFEAVRLICMFMNDTMMAEEFCRLYPFDTSNLHPNIIAKIYIAYRGFSHMDDLMWNQTQAEMYNFVHGLMVNLKSEVNGFVNPIIKVKG